MHPELELRLDVGRLAPGFIYEREDGHVPGIPAVHGFVTNLALGVTALLERQVSRHHLIFGNAIGTFEDDHCFTMWHMVDHLEGSAGTLASWQINQ